MMYDVGAQPTTAVCHVSVTVEPLADVENPVGTAGAAPQPPATITTISFDGPLTPLAFCASTRTKYVPGPTPVAVKVGAADPVPEFARLERPLEDPAWTI